MGKFIKNLRIVFILALLLNSFGAFAQFKITCIGKAGNPVECPTKNISYNQLFYFQFEGTWDDRFNNTTNIIIYANDVPLPYYVCSGVNKLSKKVFFKIEVKKNATDNSQKTLVELIRRDFVNYNNQIPLQFSVGLRDGSLIYTQPGKTQFFFYNPTLAVVVTILGVILFFIGFFLLNKIGALDETPTDPNKSLRKFQIVFWTLIIGFCYFSLWLILQDAPILPASVIGLLSISLGVTLISSFIPQAKGGVNYITNNNVITKTRIAATTGFKGLLVDNEDQFSVTRLQFWLFTIVFGLIFIYTAMYELSIYDFSLQQLTLMGVSSAGYLGMKAAKAS